MHKMKIVLTGSLGNITKPLAVQLLSKGHHITIISSNSEKQKDIEALGAKAVIGFVEDEAFLSHTFLDADIVYCMVPPVQFFNQNYDAVANYTQVGINYYNAIVKAGVKKVIHLSSIGAHLSSGTGIIIGHYNVEQQLQKLPSDVAIATIRPTAFYQNLFGYIGAIKNAGAIMANYGEEDSIAWVSPLDIANAIAEEIANGIEDRKIRYVASEELKCNEVASLLGNAINKPDLQWELVSNDAMQSNMERIGMAAHNAAGLVAMNASMHNGVFFEDYYKNKPILGKVKMIDFANDFAKMYNK
jgi:uncharacterized protein YbjT (DUF2867 family)